MDGSPIETPEGPNIGLIGSPRRTADQQLCFIETPHRKVKRTVGYDEPNLTQYETAPTRWPRVASHPQGGQADQRGCGRQLKRRPAPS
jgi:DNA-directed RNA polymerase beta subunit